MSCIPIQQILVNPFVQPFMKWVPKEAIPSLLYATLHNVLIIGRIIPITLVLQSMIGLVRPCSRRDYSPPGWNFPLHPHAAVSKFRSAQFRRSNWSANHLSHRHPSRIQRPITCHADRIRLRGRFRSKWSDYTRHLRPHQPFNNEERLKVVSEECRRLASLGLANSSPRGR